MRFAPPLLALVMAGCLSFSPQAPPTTFSAEASDPSLFLGYDHGAATRTAGNGTFRLDVDAATNTGSAVAGFSAQGGAMVATFTRFAQSAPFQDGGVRNAFHEHGSSGNGDPNLPQFRVFSAGWGLGEVTMDGTPFVDPLTGSTEYRLHYMVAADAPRNPSSLRVTKGDGNTIYDPQTPGDALVTRNSPMVLVNVQSTFTGPVPNDTRLEFGDTVNEPDYANDIPFEVALPIAHVLVNFTVSNPTPAPTLGQLAFTVLDPTGSEAGSWTYDPTTGGLQGASAGSVDLPQPVAGNYTVHVEGSAVQASVVVQVVVDYEPPLFLHVVYTQVDRLSDPRLVDSV